MAASQPFSLLEGGEKMSDVKLIVGVEESLSFDALNKGIKSIVDQINKTPPKIAVDIDEASIGRIRKTLSTLGKDIGVDLKFLNTISQQVGNTGKNAGSAFAKNFNGAMSSINVQTGTSVENIERMKKLLASNNIDSTAIDKVTKNLSSMDIEIKKIHTDLSSERMRLNITGVDELGRSITVIKEFNYAADEVSTVSTHINQSFETTADAAKHFQKEVNSAFSNIKKIAAKINENKIALVKLDPDANQEEFDKVKTQLERDSKEFNKIFDTFGGYFSHDQLLELSAAFEKVDDQTAKWLSRFNDNSKIKKTTAEIRELTELVGKVNNLNIKSHKELLSGNQNKADSYTLEKSGYINRINEILNSLKDSLPDDQFKELTKEIYGSSYALEHLNAEYQDTLDKASKKIELKVETKSIDLDVAKAESDFKKISDSKNSRLPSIESDIARLKELRDLMSNQSGNALISTYEEFDSVLKRVTNSIKIVSVESKSETMNTNEQAEAVNKLSKLLSTCKTRQEEWSAAARGDTKGAFDVYKKTADSIEALISKVNSGDISVEEFSKEFKTLKQNVENSDSVIRGAGKNVRSFGDNLKKVVGAFTKWKSAYEIFNMIKRVLKEVAEEVRAIDTAMTELKKVTDATDSEYKDFLKDATNRAKELGATLVDTISASADMARLGYDLDAAAALADSALVYKNVGDGISDIDEASASIISTMQAFGIEAENSMRIVDKFNKAGNEFAISSGGVGDALLNSASALAAAGNSIDESIGLITAANTVVQDPSKVGTTLKTISMFLRASKTDAEAAGESTEGMAESVSKLRTEILQLTGGRVDIQLDENTYKNTTEILRELSQVWSSLSDITQANILERIGGKRNANVTAALLENFEIVDKVITSTSNSTGSALAENEKYLDSINGKIAQFKATFQDLSQSILSSELIKLVVDLGTLGLSAIDGIADGLGSVVGFVDKLIPGLKIIVPLFAAKKIGQKFDIFDSIKDFAQKGFGKIGSFFGGLVDAAEDSTHTISGIFKGLFKKLSWKNLSGFGKFSAIALGISAVVAGFDYLSKSAERSRKKLQDISSEYNENKEQLGSLNSELETTRLRMYELINADTLTYVEREELEKLKETNKELEREIGLLSEREKILKADKESSFAETAKNTLHSKLTAFNGLNIEEFLEFISSEILNAGEGLGEGDFGNLLNLKDSVYVASSRLKEYKKKLLEFEEFKEKYYKSSDASDRSRFKKKMDETEEDYREISSYLTSYISNLQSDLDNIMSSHEYGTDSYIDDMIDEYNYWIDRIQIGLGSDTAKDNAFNRLINQEFDAATDLLEEQGKLGKVTAKSVQEAFDKSDYASDSFKNFIYHLKAIGYISDTTPESLAKVARAFNKLGNEAQESSDSIDDAFKRWEDAQSEVQSGVQFDSLIDAINHVHDTVSDRTSDIFGKIGNSDYKAAIDLIIPVDADVDEKSLIETSKYIKENIKKYFTFDDDGNYKGLNVNKFLSESAKAEIMEFDKNSGLYKILNGVSVEKWAKELGVAVPLVKAFIGELNEYGGDIQILELDDNLESLAKNAKSALTSLEESFDDLDIDLDLTGKTNVEKIDHLNGLITKLTEKRKTEGLDATSYNNLTKVMEHCIKQKQILEQPSVMYVDTTQLTDDNLAAQIEKVQNFVNSYHEFELLCQLGYDTDEAEDNLQETILELGEDAELSTKFKIDTKSTDSVADQLYRDVNKVIDSFGLPEDIFKPAVDATATMANNINEIISGHRDLVFNISKENGKIRISVDSQEIENAKEQKEEVEKPSFVDIFLSSITRSGMAKVETYKSILDTMSRTKYKTQLEVKATLNDSSIQNSGNSSTIKDWWNGIWGNKAEVTGTANAKGSFGFTGGESLVGELGQELVVDPKTSTWYTVGDHGAEFANIPKDAIIFNHKQTEGLLKDGHIFGRGKAYAGGLNSNIVLTGNKYLDNKLTPQLTPQTPQTVVNVTNNVTNNQTGLVDLGDALKDANVIKNNTNTNNGSKNAVSGTASVVNPSQIVNGSGGSSGSDKSKETIDYVEIRLDRLGRSLEKASEAADATSRSFKARSKSIDEEISATKKLITANDKAATTYKNKADSVKLSSGLKEKVRNGDYKITDYDSDTAELINQYKEYYEKYLDTTAEVTRQKLTKAELQMEKFALTQQKYDSKYELQDAKTSLYEAKDEKAELEGKGGSITAQNELIDIQERRKKLLKEEQKELEKLANSGEIKKGTEDWYELQTAIVEVKSDIIDVDNEIAKLEQRKIEIRYEKFENTKDDYEDRIALKDNRIEYYEAKNEEAELAGKSGSISAQKSMIKLNQDRLELLKNEREELRKLVKKIPEGTDEWYDAKQAIQDINVEIVNTNNEISKINDNIDAINLDRFKKVAEDFEPLHSETDARISYYEDSNTKHELLGNHGSIYAQDKMIEWNDEYIKNLKDEEAEMRKRLKDIDKDSPEYQEAISDLRSHLDKIRDAENKQIEYENNKRQILFARYQEIQTLYDSKMSNLDHKVSKVNHEITMLETNGYKVTKDFYESQKSIEEKRLSVLQREYNELKTAFEEAVETGEIKKYSQEWYDYQLVMNGVEQSINETEQSMASLDKTMRDLEWENFTYLRDTISELNDEADFYIELMSDKDLYDDKGNITEHGMATMGLYAQKYNTYLEEAAVYQKELAKIEARLANDPNNTELIDKKRELTEAMRDNIVAAKDEKQAMVDLVEDGINYELDALQELIDEYKTALDRAKDLHDYEKKVADSTSEISSIKKQISAYQGDDSQEAKLRIQKLQNDLKEAEENLEETEYERYISDQKELLDEFYNEYETNLNARLDNVDVLLNNVVTSINTNSGSINETLNGLASDFGIKLSGELQNIWGNSTFDQVVRSYVGEDSTIVREQTAVLSTLRGIEDKVNRIINNTPPSTQSTNSNSTTGSGTNTSTQTPIVNTGNNGGQSSGGINSPSQNTGDNNKTGYSLGSGIVLSKALIYDSPSEEGRTYNRLTSQKDEYYITKIVGDYLGISYKNKNQKNPTTWIKASEGNFNVYKNGGIVDYTGLAWVDGTKSNPEYMLNAEDTANLMKLTEDLRKLYSLRTNIAGVAKEASGAIKSGLLDTGKISDISKAGAKSVNSIGDINITIPIERVQDYNDFVTQLKDDPKFDKFIKSVSVDLLDGKSRLAKNKFNWNK